MQYYTGKKDCASKKCASWPGSQEQGTWAHAINANDARKEVKTVCDLSIQYVIYLNMNNWYEYNPFRKMIR